MLSGYGSRFAPASTHTPSHDIQPHVSASYVRLLFHRVRSLISPTRRWLKAPTSHFSHYLPTLEHSVWFKTYLEYQYYGTMASMYCLRSTVVVTVPNGNFHWTRTPHLFNISTTAAQDTHTNLMTPPHVVYSTGFHTSNT